MNVVHPAQGVDERSILQIRVPLVVEMRQRVRPLVLQIIRGHRERGDIAGLGRNQQAEHRRRRQRRVKIATAQCRSPREFWKRF